MIFVVPDENLENLKTQEITVPHASIIVGEMAENALRLKANGKSKSAESKLFKNARKAIKNHEIVDYAPVKSIKQYVVGIDELICIKNVEYSQQRSGKEDLETKRLKAENERLKAENERLEAKIKHFAEN